MNHVLFPKKTDYGFRFLAIDTVPNHLIHLHAVEMVLKLGSAKGTELAKSS